MRAQKTSGLEQLLYGAPEEHGKEHPAPSAATLLVSLFLILITFFVILNNNAKPDTAKRKVVLESMKEKFGGPTNELQAFGGMVQPKVEEFTVRLGRLLGKNAVVESTIEGDQTKIIFAKDLLFYSDETEMRSDKIILAKRTADIIKELQAGNKFRISIIMGLEEYDLDKKKLSTLKNALNISGAEIGLSDGLGNQIILVVANE
jgi:hypothetical protein